MFFPFITSAKGRKLLESFEGCKLSAYRDQKGIPTIGYGHTAGVQMGQTVTQAQADALLGQDLKDAEFAVNTAIRHCEQNQFDAMVSLCFNIGETAFRNSTLVKDMNTGNISGAASAFLSWVYAGKEVDKGLLARRQAEKALFEAA